MLDIQHLSWRYPQAAQASLSGITLQAQAGQILGLLGPNGAGKTTLIAHLSGQLPIQSGSIHYQGQTLTALRQRDPTRIAIAPQEYAFYGRLTVQENLHSFARLNRLSGAQRQTRIDACLTFGQLERFAKHRADTLSGGLKRRLNLAIALLAEPDVLLLDEPTVGIDPQSRAFILDAVKHLAQQGLCVLYTTHYMEEVEAIADHIAILDYGKILCSGPLQHLLAQNNASLHLEFANSPSQHALVQQTLTPFGNVQQQASNWQLTPHANTPLSAILHSLETHNLAPTKLRYGHDNLETLFLSLTQRSLRD